MSDIEKQNPASNGVGSADCSAIERHLVDDGWLMRADDEALDHDCQTWWRLDSHPSGKWMIGAPYARGLFVPIRRNGPRPPNEIEIILSSPNTRICPTEK